MLLCHFFLGLSFLTPFLNIADSRGELVQATTSGIAPASSSSSAPSPVPASPVPTIPVSGATDEWNVYSRIQEWMNHPYWGPKIRRLGESAHEPEFQKAAVEIQKNQNLKWMYLGLLFYFGACIVIRRWWLAATDRFLMRLVLRAGLSLVFMGGSFLVSYVVLGQPLLVVLMAFARAVLA